MKPMSDEPKSNPQEWVETPDMFGAYPRLTDDQIAKKLDDNGIHVTRRTVAKYREAMRIPSSVQRRREKPVAPAAAH